MKPKTKPKTNLTLNLKITVVIEPDDNRFHAYCPALKGLHVDGDTEEDALKNASDAIVVYLDSLARHNDPLPIGQDFTVEHEIKLPRRATKRNITFEWPSLLTPGNNLRDAPQMI
jgi:predicted RNase H-like HicB family nuclease